MTAARTIARSAFLELSRTDKRVLRHHPFQEFRIAMAFRSGMEMSVMQGCVLLDGDLQDTPRMIGSFNEKWVEGYDVV